MISLVVIEDDDRIREPLEKAMVARGYVVVGARNGLDGYARVVDRKPDVVLLDLGLPDVDGVDVLTMIRSVCATPVIVTTARDQDTDIVKTLDAGADDYLIKPFTADHLEARIRAVMRRTQPGLAKPVHIADLFIDPAQRTASLDGQLLDLSRKEFDLLLYLGARVQQVVSKRELLGAIWDQPWGGSDKTVDVHLSWLRRKLGETAHGPRYIRSVRGVGIMLVDPNA